MSTAKGFMGRVRGASMSASKRGIVGVLKGLYGG